MDDKLEVSTQGILELYRRFADDLRSTRARMRRLYRSRCVPWRNRSLLHKIAARAVQPFAGAVGLQPRMLAQSDDETCEILYLLLRAERPERVVEISPFHGWSTCWILSALRDNGRGKLVSHDLIDASSKNVPAELAKDRWQLVLGDARKEVAASGEPIDFLLMDSDHSAEFAHWYLDTVLPRVRDGAVVCVDDVFHHADPAIFDGEGPVVLDWLKRRGISYFTCAKPKNPSALNALHGQKVSLRLAERIHTSDANPAILFRNRK
ncbi:MAG: class I SAM-dependent methyltransferase [Planctomycetes bacterium]|nr:class I SAM-dependent methyltransferase [Planctomycetota bacterium]